METAITIPRVHAKLRSTIADHGPSVQELIDSGREREALEKGLQQHGPLEHWAEQGLAKQAILLLERLGAERKAASLALREWRRHPLNHELREAALRTVLRRRGPLAAWMLMQRWPEPTAVALTAGPLLLLQSQVHEELGNHVAAERCRETALEAGMVRREIKGIQALAILRSKGQFVEHEAEATYRWEVARFLISKGQWAAAESLLTECAEDTQSSIPLEMLVVAQLKRRRAVEALATLETFSKTAALLEPAAGEWQACLRALCLLMSGNPGRAAEALDLAGNAEGRKLTGRLRGIKFHADAAAEQAALEIELERAAEKWSLHAAPVHEERFLSWLEKRQSWAGLVEWHQLQFLRTGAEGSVEALLKAACAAGKVPGALAFLEDLAERAGTVSTSLALAKAFELTGHTTKARMQLEMLAAASSQDSDSGLALVDFMARHGFADEARYRMARLETNTPRRIWFTLAAKQAELCGDWPSAQFDWREVLVRSPMDPAATANLALATRLVEGPQAAARHLEELCESHPDDASLHALWLEHAPAEAHLNILNKLLKLQPEELKWLKRKALLLTPEKGLELLKQSQPASKSALLLIARARLELKLDKVEEAKNSLEMAVGHGADQPGILSGAMSMTPWLADRRRLLDRQSHAIETKRGGPEALLIWVAQALELLPASECLVSLRRWKAARPGAWQAAVALSRVLESLKRYPEATDEISRSLQSMPHEADLWIELAHLHSRRQQPEEELAALSKAVLLGGNVGTLWLRVAELHQMAGRKDQVLEALDSACGLAPRDAKVRDRASQIYWLAGEKETALRQLKHALHLEPELADAWDRLASWAKALGQTDLPASMAWDLAAKRPGQAIAWLTLARVMSQIGDETNAEMALNKAENLEPKHLSLHQLRVQWLVSRERHDEALAACRPSIFGKEIPWQLTARAAWVEASRNDLPRAILMMRPIVEAHSGDAWCRKELVSWLLASGRQLEAEQLAGKGAAQLDEEEANAPLELRLTTQTTPFERLAEFDLALKKGELDEATSLLSVLQEEVPGPLVTARAGQLAAAKGDAEQVISCFQKVICEPFDDAWPLLTTLSSLEKLAGRGKTMKLLEEASQKPGINKWVLAAWVDKLNETSWKGLPSRVSKAAPENPGACEAIISYLEKLAAVSKGCIGKEMEKQRRAFQDLASEALTEHSAWLRKTNRGWLAGGMALNAVHLPALAGKWFADWKGRGVITPAALEQVLCSLQSNGSHVDAQLLIRETLANGPSLPRFHIWDALYKSLDGRHEEAQKTLDRCARPPQGEDLRTASRLGRMLIKMADPKETNLFNGATRETILDFWKQNKNLCLTPLMRQTCAQVGLRTKSPWPIFWGFWKAHRKWLKPTLIISGMLFISFVLLLVKFPHQMHSLFPWLGDK